MKNTSRAGRLSQVVGAFNSAKDDAVGEIESLRDELQEWLDNMPENLQGGEKAGQLDEAIAALDELLDALGSVDELDDSTVDFPGMF